MNKLIFWAIVFCVIFASIALISNVLVPFIAAFIIAYMLRPLIDWISNCCKLSKKATSYLVFFLFINVFIILFILLFPIIYHQTAILINKTPLYKSYLQAEFVPFIMQKFHSMDPEIAYKVKESVDGFFNITFSAISVLFNNLWGYTLATIHVFTVLILVPILLFYFLKDWPKMMSFIEQLLPMKNKDKILEILSSINSLLSAYVRGQLNVCLLLSCYYGIVLTLIGVDLSLLLAALSGFLIIIPFIGTSISFSLALIISYFKFGLTLKLSYVIITYVIGYFAEIYILNPKILGDRIGMHPLWIMFAVFACGSVFGFWGIFFAIPIAGIIKIILQFTIRWYKSSRFYY